MHLYISPIARRDTNLLRLLLFPPTVNMNEPLSLYITEPYLHVFPNYAYSWTGVVPRLTSIYSNSPNLTRAEL